MLRSCASLARTLFVVLLSATTVSAQALSFVQVSDPHLYDGGRDRSPDAFLVAQAEHQSALLAAILRINRLVQQGRRFDFVVVTGDFGIQSLEEAVVESRAVELARALGALLVRRILVLPGDADGPRDPTATRERFLRFFDVLRRELPGKELTDLTQTSALIEGFSIVGIDTRVFTRLAGGSRAVASIAAETAELKRVTEAIVAGQHTILMAHVPPIDDPSAPESSTPLWTFSPGGEDALTQLFDRPEVLALFSGHIHVPRPDLYGRRLELTAAKPRDGRSLGVWLAPPLGRLRFVPGVNEQQRGFLVATVTTVGDIVVMPEWLESSVGTTVPDKNSELIKAQLHEGSGDLDESNAAYDRAMSSTDPNVRAAAEQGYRRTHEGMESRRWRLVQEFSPVRLAWHYYEYSLAAFALVIALIASGCAWTYYREPVVEVPTKLGADSPAELFLAELRVAIPEAKRLIGAEQLYGSLGPVSAAVSFSTPMADEWRTLIESLPPIGEIKTGDVLSAIVGLFGRLRRRIELHVGGSVEDVTAFATLRRGAQILATWRIAADEDGPLDVRRAADQLAYNLLWELRR